MTNSNTMTVVALMNAMIGGTILVLPLLFLKSGIIISAIVTIITGFINYYSCKICLDHLQDDIDLPQTIFRHTHKKIFVQLYNISIYLSVILILLLYFDLIVKQWQSILNVKSILISIINFIVLVALTIVMKKIQFGVNLLGIGVLSIFGYLIFLSWVYLSSPNGQKQFILASADFASLADTLATAFSLQGIFIPILRQNKKQKDAPKLLFFAYLFGGIIYSYVGFSGAYGILNRQPVNSNPQTVQQFFQANNWQVTLIASIYLFHLYSVFPQYTLIGKVRFYELFHIKQEKGISKKDLAFIFSTILICFLTYIAQIPLQTLLAINGTLFGFFFIYLLPALLHIKCTYKPQKSKQIQLVKMQNQSVQKKQDEISQQPKYIDFKNENETNNDKVQKQIGMVEQIVYGCKRQVSLKQRYTHNILVVMMTAFGIFIFIFSSYSLLKSK